MKLRIAIATIALLTAAGCGGLVDAVDELKSPRPTGCLIGEPETPMHLGAEQSYYAATIAAVGRSMGMNEQAVTVALATAFQESGMRNIDYGDRDSLGLFQQRPSMGWGTEEQLMDPVYASFKFYEKLQRIDGWEDMRVTDAAQAVQISAHPEEYEKWGDDARVLARAFVGGQPGAVACLTGHREDASTEAAAFAADHAEEWGVEAAAADDRTVRIAADGDDGWNWAAWSATKTFEYAIAAVEYSGHRWESGDETWTALSEEDEWESGVIVVEFPEGA
jgi:hypothetical protein